MRKQIQLTVPTPCHESWDEMAPVEKGKFCNSCKKEVIDFTKMSDTQLVAFFCKKTTGSVCGHFMQDQLYRSMEIPKKRIRLVKYFFQFALPAFLASTKAASQGQVMLLTGDTVIVANSNRKETKNVIAKGIGKKIDGKIADEMGNGIPYASIYIKGTTIGAATDSSGSFSLEYGGLGDPVVLVASSVGFQTAEIELTFNQCEAPIVMTLNAVEALDEVVVSSSVGIRGRVVSGFTGIITKTNVFDVIRDNVFSAKQTLKIYPNPIQRNSSLSIEVTKGEGGNHLFQVLTMSGQIILVKELWIDKNNGVVKLNIPSVAAGTYLLMTVNKQSGKSTTEKIIVE